jgi:hypothetical protein
MVKTPKPGVYRGISHEVYSSWPAANHSRIKEMERSPLHARYVSTVPRAPTPALELGDATHACVLEPARFEAEFVEAPSGDRRTKVVRDAWDEVQKAHPHANPLRPQDYARILAMKDAVHAHPIAHQLIQDAALVEASFLWKDIESGLLCKGRLDLLTRWRGWSCIVDLKTTTDAREWAFSKSCATYWYHSQAAFYLQGLDALAPADRRFLFIVVEKDPPHGVMVHELSEADLEVGRIALRRWLKGWAECEETDTWPGYPEVIGKAALPSWAMNWDEGESNEW